MPVYYFISGKVVLILEISFLISRHFIHGSSAPTDTNLFALRKISGIHYNHTIKTNTETIFKDEEKSFIIEKSFKNHS